MKAKIFLEDEKIFTSDNLISDPAISVILPTYCRGDNGLLERSIKSVLNQTFKSFELIIVDDGSVDGTQEVIKKYIKVDNRIVYIRNDINSGLPALRVNQGLMHSRGEYIAYQFDDDQWLETALESLYTYILDKNCQFVYGKCLVKAKENITYEFGKKFNYSELIECNRIANNTVLHSKGLLESYGAYDCHLAMRRLCDWDLWLRWSKEVTFIFLDELISIVEMNVENSLGETCIYDQETFRLFQSLDRSDKLKLSNLKSYEVDDISFISDKNLVFNKHVYSWYLKKRFLIADKEKYNLDKKNVNILVTKGIFDSTIDITITNFSKLFGSKYNFIYVPEQQLSDNIIDTCEIIILHRTCSSFSTEYLKKYKSKKTIIYFIDDDLLNFYKLDDCFSYIAPGTEMYENLVYQITNADQIVTYSDLISKSVSKYNNKIIRLYTNILKKYIDKPIQKNEGCFKIAFIGGNARKAELNFIWDDILFISQKYKNKVEFYFWGYIPEKISQIINSKVFTEEYTSSYYEYLNRLHNENFDIILSPLFEDEAKLCKSPIKFLEASVCNAIGLFSDVAPYEEIVHEVNGVKVKNEKRKWAEAIQYIIELPYEKKQNIINNNKKYVSKKYTTESQVNMFEATLESGRLHYYLWEEGSICYVIHSAYLGGAENHILRHALLAKKYNFRVIVCLPKIFEEKNEMVQVICQNNNIELIFLNFTNYINIQDINQEKSLYESREFERLIKDKNIKIVHAVTLIPGASIAAARLNITYINSLYAVEKNNHNNYIEGVIPKFIHSDSVYFCNIWTEITKAFSTCIRSWIPNEFFREKNILLNRNKTIKIAISGTIQPRKGQDKVIEIVGMLNKNGYDVELYILGYSDFFLDYIEQCKNIAQKYNIVDKIIFKGFCKDMIKELETMDALVCASDWESFPQAILEAMAMKIAIISTPVTGVPELILDGITGYLAKGFEVEDLYEAMLRFVLDYKDNNKKLTYIINNAFKIAYDECNEDYVRKELFKLYNKAISETVNEIRQVEQLIPVANKSILDSNEHTTITFKEEYLIHNTLHTPKEQNIGNRKYKIYVTNDYLDSIKINFKNIKNYNCVVKIEVFLDNKKDFIVRTSKAYLSEITEDGLLKFSFEAPLNVKGKIINIRILLEGKEKRVAKIMTYKDYVYGKASYLDVHKTMGSKT